MKNYFSVLGWVTNMNYHPTHEENSEIFNALVPLEETDWNQDFKIGERVLPGYNLLWKFHEACVRWIQLENGSFNPKSNDISLKMEDVFDRFERVSNTTYLSWFLSNSEDNYIPDYLNSDGEVNPNYEEYKNYYIKTKLSETRQEDNAEFFFNECIMISRIEVVDIIYDFINQRKVYVLEMKPFRY
jgi:hypothetical protein